MDFVFLMSPLRNCFDYIKYIWNGKQRNNDNKAITTLKIYKKKTKKCEPKTKIKINYDGCGVVPDAQGSLWHAFNCVHVLPLPE